MGKAEDILENEFKVMNLFIDNAKTYTQIAGAGLALSVIFMREVVGLQSGAPMPVNRTLIVSWVCLLISVLTSSYYQYLAVKNLEKKSNVDCDHFQFPAFLIDHPWPVYLLMMISFYAGAILFTIDAIRRLTS